MKYKWPLNTSHFTFLDRIKIASFILNPKNQWTQGTRVQEFERKMAAYIGCKFAVFVSSGSTANTLLASYIKDTTKKTKIVLPAVTWQTSCSPWIREGFEPVFIDVTTSDFSMDLNLLESYLKNNSQDVACVFITSLIGLSPDIERSKNLALKYNVKIMLDNCEANISQYNNINISNFFTSTTSTYFGHMIQSIEGGFIFTNDPKEYQYFLLNRNHGMVRSLKNTTFGAGIGAESFRNHMVDERFDFYSLGNNYRNTDLNAFIGMLDFKRVEEYKEKRIELYNLFKTLINKDDFLVIENQEARTHVPFCIPIIFKNNNKSMERAKFYCEQVGIEVRPLISGNLLRQRCYQKYGNPIDYPIAEFINNNAFYVGLYANLNPRRIEQLAKYLNNI